MKKEKAAKSSMDWYFPRVNGLVALPVNRARHDTTHGLFMKKNVSDRSSKGHRFGAFWMFAVLFLCGVLQAAEPAKIAVQPKQEVAAKLIETQPAADEVSVKRTMETTKGEVVSVSPTSLTVLYGSDEKNEYEKLIPFNKAMKLDGYKKSSDIQVGDVVELGYERAMELKGKSVERVTMTMKSIRLVKRPSANVLAAEEKT